MRKDMDHKEEINQKYGKLGSAIDTLTRVLDKPRGSDIRRGIIRRELTVIKNTCRSIDEIATLMVRFDDSLSPSQMRVKRRKPRRKR